LSPRLFAEEVDSPPRDEGEKTSNPVLSGTHYDSNACVLQCFSYS
jgi:hypothetical protein